MPMQIQNALPAASAPSAPAVKPRAAAPPARESPPAAAPAEDALAVEQEALKRAVESINRRLERSVNNLRFSLDGDTGKVVIKVVDAATDQVIRQIPSEEALAISRSMERLQGLLLDQQA
jgi:flagellar protein FlaG